MSDAGELDRRKKLKVEMDALTQKRQKMIELEKSKASQREDTQESVRAQEKMAVAAESTKKQQRADDREQWRQDTHQKRREEQAQKQVQEKEAKAQAQRDEEKKKAQEERDQALRDFHAANVDKKVKEKIKRAEEQEQKDVAAIAQRLTSKVAEVRVLLERESKHLKNEQQKKEKDAHTKADQMRSKLSADFEALYKSKGGGDASEAARNRTKGMLTVDAQLEKQLLDIRTEAERLKVELERRAQEKIDRLTHDADRQKMEAHKKLLGVLEWFNRDTEVVKDPLDL